MWPPVAAMSLLLDADDLPAECPNNSWITFVSCDVIFPPSPMAPTRRTLHLISHITSNKIFLVTPSVAFSSSNHSKECRDKRVFCCKTRISSLINHIKINTGRFYFDYWHRLFHFRTVSFKLDVCWNSHLHKYFFFLYWLPSCWRGAIIYSSKYSTISLVTCTLLLNLDNHLSTRVSIISVITVLVYVLLFEMSVLTVVWMIGYVFIRHCFQHLSPTILSSLPLINASIITGLQPLPFFLSQQLLAQWCNKARLPVLLLIQYIRSSSWWDTPQAKA